MLQVPAHRPREDCLLQITAFGDELFHLVAMRDARYILLDDRPGIQLVGYVMAGGADQLDAALERRMIWPRTAECR